MGDGEDNDMGEKNGGKDKKKSHENEELWKESSETQPQFASSSFRPKLLHHRMIDLSPV